MVGQTVPGQRRPAPPLTELQARIAVISLHPETLSLQSALSFGKQQHLDTSSLRFLTSSRCSSRRARNGTRGPTAWSREGQEKHSRWQDEGKWSSRSSRDQLGSRS